MKNALILPDNSSEYNRHHRKTDCVPASLIQDIEKRPSPPPMTKQEATDCDEAIRREWAESQDHRANARRLLYQLAIRKGFCHLRPLPKKGDTEAFPLYTSIEDYAKDRRHIGAKQCENLLRATEIELALVANLSEGFRTLVLGEMPLYETHLRVLAENVNEASWVQVVEDAYRNAGMKRPDANALREAAKARDAYHQRNRGTPVKRKGDRQTKVARLEHYYNKAEQVLNVVCYTDGGEDSKKSIPLSDILPKLPTDVLLAELERRQVPFTVSTPADGMCGSTVLLSTTESPQNFSSGDAPEPIASAVVTLSDDLIEDEADPFDDSAEPESEDRPRTRVTFQQGDRLWRGDRLREHPGDTRYLKVTAADGKGLLWGHWAGDSMGEKTFYEARFVGWEVETLSSRCAPPTAPRLPEETEVKAEPPTPPTMPSAPVLEGMRRLDLSDPFMQRKVMA